MSKTGSDSHPPVPPHLQTQAAWRDVWDWIRLHPVRNLSILMLLTLAVTLLGSWLSYLAPVETRVKPASEFVAESLQLLDEGVLAEARDRAADLRLRTDIVAEELGVAPYVLGAVMFAEAQEQMVPRERQDYFLLAARYLEESQRLGFPPGRKAAGLWMLGQAWYGCDRYAAALPALLAALEADPQQATRICRLITECYLRDKVPNPTRAAEFNARYLADPQLTREERDAALLTQARITFELGRFAECAQQIDQFPADGVGYAEVILLRGRLLLREEKYSEARELFVEAQDRALRDSALIRQSQYLQGICLRKLGDLLAAETIQARNRRVYLDTPEGLASGVEEAELLHLRGDDVEALAAFRRVLRPLNGNTMRMRPWITDDDLRVRLEAIITEHRRQGHYDAGAALLPLLALVFSDARAVELQANYYQEWAEYLAQRSASPQTKDAIAQRTDSRHKYRQAGVDFGRLAKLRFATREYPQDLWRSAENFLLGHDYENAVLVYGKNLEAQNRAGRPPALTRLGECLLALNRPEEALRHVQECIEFFPKDPFVYKARLIAAEAQLELGRDQLARDLLTANLENESLTPQSREWRDSLFLMGRVAYLDGMRKQTVARQKGIDNFTGSAEIPGLKDLEEARHSFEECIARLSEAVERDPRASQAIEARYLLGMSHIHSARVPRVLLSGVNIETTRVTLRRELKRELEEAIAEFDRLRTILVERQERGDLTVVDQRILRNCFFQKADALFDLDQYEEAIQAYSSATNRYQQEPESLEAFVQIAVCQRKLGKALDARRTLEQAKLVLARMPPTVVCEQTTRYSRPEWTNLLSWLSTL